MSDQELPTVVSIHLALATRLPMRMTESITLTAGKGIPGDRYENSRHRHITVQSQTDLDEASVKLGSPIAAADTRRNITVSSGEVPSCPGDRLFIGTVELEVVRIAAPCKLLDDGIIPGARAALRRRAGSVCRVLAGGTIDVGDSVNMAVTNSEG